MTSFYDKLSELAVANVPFVSVILVDVIGSAPQDRGAKMLVTKDGLYFGTVGGGKIEKKAIEEAQRLLAAADPSQRTHFVQWSLTRDIGMTCGGGVKLYFEVFNLNTWDIVVFGAGHVAQSLIGLLLGLDCRITCIDPRQEWLERLPQSPKLKTVLATDMPSEVKNLPEDAFVILMTMGHTTDKPILLEILRTRKFPYVGVIGSKAKAVRLKKDVIEAGLPAELQSAFYCPIGLDIGSNHPQEIAVSVAAQLIQLRDHLRTPD
ncbi:MAG TPA: xanthine dehydrogenase accessory protein XdhC [Candidatus Obscuribacterales bacterium]